MRDRTCFSYLRWTEVLIGLMLAAQVAFGGDIAERGPAVGPGEPGGSVRFQLYQGYLVVVHGSMGEAKNLNILLDTGVTQSLLDLRVARKLHLRGEASVSVVRLDRRVAAEEMSLPSLEIGPLSCSNLRVLTADLSFYEKVIPVRIDAVVGLDVLGQRPFVIDYRARALRLEAASAVEEVSLPLRLDRGVAVLDAEIDHARVRLLLDTGAGFMVLFDRAIPRSTGGKEDLANESREAAAWEEKRIWLRTLRLGGEEFGQKPAVLMRNPKPARIDVDGLVSPAALGISRVAVDLKAGVLAFSR